MRWLRTFFVAGTIACITLIVTPTLAQNAASSTAPVPTAPGQRVVAEVGTMEYLKEQWEAGGYTMYFILALSLMGVASVLERMVNLNRNKIAPHGLATKADSLWKAGQYDEILKLCANSPSTLARVIEYAVENREGSAADINVGAGDVASEEMRKHYQRAYYLAIAATVAPLLGLFGTIVGMMGAFEVVSVAGGMGGDPGMLAKDISKALVTTAAGLIVAMPALFLYHIIKMRTANLGSLLQKEANHLITRWFMGRNGKVQEAVSNAR